MQRMQSGEERVCQRPKSRALDQPDGAGTCPCCAGENPVCDAHALAESCYSEPPKRWLRSARKQPVAPGGGVCALKPLPSVAF